MHCVSTYLKDEDAKAIITLREKYKVQRYYSGHGPHLKCIATLGATSIERHITLEIMYGSDQGLLLNMEF